MLNDWLLTTEGPIKFKPVPLERIEPLEEMLSLVRVSELAEFRDVLCQKILDLHPRDDVSGAWGVELGVLPQGCFNEVFGVAGVIERINRFVPNDPEEGDADQYPPWSSGNLHTDFLADLTFSLGSFEQASQAVELLGLQSIANLLKRLGDLHKGPEGREKTGLKKWFWENVRQFDDGFFEE